jgi:hypothetical protein
MFYKPCEANIHRRRDSGELGHAPFEINAPKAWIAKVTKAIATSQALPFPIRDLSF